MPRTDGILLSDNAQQLIEEGKVANVPIVSGMSCHLYSHRQ